MRLQWRSKGHSKLRKIALGVGAALVAGVVPAQQAPDAVPSRPQDYQATYSRILTAVEKIPIFDNHSHPGFADDPDVDAMASPPGSIALRLRPDNPELIAASKDLFGYPFADATPEHLEWLRKKKAELRRQQTGYSYFDGILDHLNVEQALANRVKLAPYLSPKRFHWVFFVDSVLFPFDNHTILTRNGDEAMFVPMQEKKLHSELAQEQLASLPANLEEYLHFISQLLEDNRQHGGIAIKFEIGYFRSLHFDDPSQTTAETIYAKYRKGGIPSEGEYKDFQDFVFRYLLREAGRLHLPVHIHTAVGVGDYYSVTESTALNLENVLRDPRYDSTTFVLLHGGYPFQEQAIWLAARKNVYLDSSLIELYMYPAQFKSVLRNWLLLFPDKIVFGSDAFPFNDAVGAEESYWIAVRTARTALAAALAEMVGNHELTEERALRLAQEYLHDNAVALYKQ
jgi:uncharacterized protein